MKFDKVTVALVVFVAYIIIGIYGINSVDYVETDRAMWVSFRWSLILALVIGAYFGYLNIVTAKKKYTSLKKAFVFIITTFAIGVLFLSAAHGYTMLYNCHIGKQSSITVKGTIIAIKIPARKKWLSRYRIEIRKKDSAEIIGLVVPTKEYVIGAPFEKEMIVGSLGFIYNDK